MDRLEVGFWIWWLNVFFGDGISFFKPQLIVDGRYNKRRMVDTFFK